MDRNTDSEENSEPRPGAASALRRGWTTGACATAAAKAAGIAIFSGTFPDPVTIRLPRGQEPAFALCRTEIGDGWAQASIIKDAGDDPDVTHGAEIAALVRLRTKVSGEPPAGAVAHVGDIRIFAGPGVGTVTLAGLPVVPGEPAVNPVPRQMISAALCDVAAQFGAAAAFDVELSVVDGEALAEKTWNPRLGIVGGLSILGTTGIVVPYSCAAWIDAIHRGVDVARAAGIDHLVGATGRGSEQAAMAHYGFDRLSMIDMGDFAGGLLKYARAHPVARLTLAGGFAKISKLAQGALDLHSARSQLAFDALADVSRELGASDAVAASILGANTGAEALAIGHDAAIDLASPVANRAADQARAIVGQAGIKLNVIIIARDGAILAETDFA